MSYYKILIENDSFVRYIISKKNIYYAGSSSELYVYIPCQLNPVFYVHPFSLVISDFIFFTVGIYKTYKKN